MRGENIHQKDRERHALRIASPDSYQNCDKSAANAENKTTGVCGWGRSIVCRHKESTKQQTAGEYLIDGLLTEQERENENRSYEGDRRMPCYNAPNQQISSAKQKRNRACFADAAAM